MLDIMYVMSLTSIFSYVGPTCGNDINECVENPCQNGGTCRNLVPGHICDCVPGFTSSDCSVNIDNCTPGK